MRCSGSFVGVLMAVNPHRLVVGAVTSKVTKISVQFRVVEAVVPVSNALDDLGGQRQRIFPSIRVGVIGINAAPEAMSPSTQMMTTRRSGEAAWVLEATASNERAAKTVAKELPV